MAGREDPRLRDIAQEALTIGDTASAVIFTVAPGSSDLELAAAAGVEGPSLLEALADRAASAVADSPDG